MIASSTAALAECSTTGTTSSSLSHNITLDRNEKDEVVCGVTVTATTNDDTCHSNKATNNGTSICTNSSGTSTSSSTGSEEDNDENEMEYESNRLLPVVDNSKLTSNDIDDNRLKLQQQQQQQQEPLSSTRNRTNSKSTNVSTRTTTSRTTRKVFLVVVVVLLLFILFVSMTTTSILYSVSVWMKYVADTYIIEQLHSLEFTESRSDSEMTYYERICGLDILTINVTAQQQQQQQNNIKSIDIVTNNPNDLLLPLSATVDDSVQHNMKYGFTVIQNVLQSNTMQLLRDHINYKNYNEESLYVIEQKNRFSILLSTTTPIVAQAMEELSNHIQFSSTLQGIAGINPALIELTAISSKYGAIDQFWHDDTSYSLGTRNYGNSFRPLYSIFIQLQDTTSAMGATNVCPGTHHCSNGPLAYMCQNFGGFPLVFNHTIPPQTKLSNSTTTTTTSHKQQGYNNNNNNVPYWKAGDALIMNMDSIHRGSAYTEPNGVDRIMLILSFVPKSLNRNEYKQMTNGITWQIQYNMWGHTLYDLQQASVVMQQPYVTIKSFGFYDYYNIGYGVDYFTANSQRYINQDNGYSYNEYNEWILNKGGLLSYNLPKFLNSIDDDDYISYYTNTLYKTILFLQNSTIILTILYILLFPILCYLFLSKHTTGSATIDGQAYTTTTKSRRYLYIQLLVFAIVQVLCINFTIFGLYKYFIQYVDNTGWAIDIKKKHRFAPIVKYEIDYFLHEKYSYFYHQIPTTTTTIGSRNCYNTTSLVRIVTEDDTRNDNDSNNNNNYDNGERKATIPTRYDVLIETRYGSKNLHSFIHFLKYHPGNVQLQQLIKSMRMTLTLLPVVPSGSSSSCNNVDSDNMQPTAFQLQMVQHVVHTMTNEYYSRFLVQYPDGSWTKMTLSETMKYIIREIQKQSNTVQSYIIQELRYIRTDDNMYGPYRDYKMTFHHTVPYLRSLEYTVLPKLTIVYPPKHIAQQQINNQFVKPVSLLSSSFHNRHLNLTKSRLYTFPTQPDTSEPYTGAWVQEKDIVEIYYQEMWYPVTVTSISPRGTFTLEFSTSEVITRTQDKIVTLQPLQINEIIGVWNKQLNDPEDNIHFQDTIVQKLISTDKKYSTGTGRSRTGCTGTSSTYEGTWRNSLGQVERIIFTTLDTVREGSYRPRQLKIDRFAANFESLLDDSEEEEDDDYDDEDTEEEDGNHDNDTEEEE